MRAGTLLLALLTGIVAAEVSPPTEVSAHESLASLPDAAVLGSAEAKIDEPPMVAALRSNGARVLALGERGGLDGHFVELADGDAYGLYVTPDGHAVAGLLYGPDGALLTGRQIAAAGGSGDRNEDVTGEGFAVLAHGFEDRSAALHAGALFERSGSAFGFTLGRSGPQAVLFADPGCRWSRSAVARLGHAALDGRLRLRVVPVGVLGLRPRGRRHRLGAGSGAGLVRRNPDSGPFRGRTADRGQQRTLRPVGRACGAAHRLAGRRRPHRTEARRRRRRRGLARGASP